MAEPMLLSDQDDGEDTESIDRLTVSDNITDLSKYDDKSMSTMKHILTSERTSSDIHLLVVGKTGQGKSTFINSLIELQREIAKEGAEADMCTKSCHSYVHPELIPGVRVRVIDSPGLQDIHADEQLYIEEIKAHCQKVSLVLYCMKMTNHRLDSDDTLALRRLHQAFGSDFLKRVVIVLTFANKEDCEKRDSRDEKDDEPPFSDREGWARLLRKRFAHRVQLRATDINAFLKQRLQIDNLVVEVVPAGYYKPTYFNPNPMKLPDQENWLHNLIKFTHSQIKKKHNFSLWNLNDKIHLAIIIDNHSEVKKEDEGTKMIDDDAQKIKEALNTLGYCTLYFKFLSSRSINTLLEVLHHIDHSQLATFAFVFLCKGKTRHLYDCNSEIIDAEKFFECLQNDQSPFAQLPKIYYFHLAHDQEPKEKLQVSSTPSKNSILLITSVIQKNSSVVLDTVTNNLKEGASIQKCFEEIRKECNRNDNIKVSCMYIDRFTDKFVLPSPYIPFNLRAEKEYYKKQLEIYRSMWHPIRSETISVISENKDKVLDIVRNERIARIAASSASLVLGGGMVVLGLALIPVTFGASVGLSVAGGLVGATASLGGVGAFIARKILENKQLKSAQDHISLDQQLSIIINEIAEKYDAAMVKCTQSALSTRGMAGNAAAGGAQGIANVGRVGMGIAVGIESAAEVGAVALRTGARVAGAVLAGVSLAVTVPIDIGFIAYHSYNIHQSSKDKTGKTDTNQVVQWLIKQIEDMLKGTCITIELQQHSIEGGIESTIESADLGYELNVLALTQEQLTINVRTIFCGPFSLPDGCTIVSAIYDITLPGELPPDFYATIKLEHCVVLNDDITPRKMCFATAVVDLEKKVFAFNCIDGGNFPIGKTYASLKIRNSCLICILYKGSMRDTSVKYASQCSYVKEYKNCWTMSILFTKCLNAHLKYAQSESIGTIESHSFLFTDWNDGQELSIGLHNFRNSMETNGWKISPISPIPNQITKAEIDSVELQQDFRKLQSRIIPLIEFSVYVDDEPASDEPASDELEKHLDIEGTTLNIFVKRQKE
ncbi:PREDICTED: uncharacterized protein LOC109590100 isoform X2 [Amphimedon queenslandica]|uniref:Caspase family p20 domain-containing protein n=1 Tax=Amphimedon queenslandica TaxID=400682 RepID=A0AAN0JXG6_AMPQE|nr:PREDICTED: uncharacterized protein LOC109590100 isoform X2 [Amphimedon queenslandica]|eukprot:XP_019861608.1 PREDICTED: uncharacterized protein LOC109590100 isoform X2 [Amphimedon queenslandica]